MQWDNITTIIFSVGIIILLIIALWRHRSKTIQWLKWAVSEAEKELGSKTGQLKLRRVYDWYLKQFPWISNIVPFCMFSHWVDIALKTMREWIEKNTPIGAYITGESSNKMEEEKCEN